MLFRSGGATGTAVLVTPGNAQPMFGNQTVNRNPQPISGINGFGTFSIQIWNTTLLSPTPVLYRFNITDATGHCSFQTGTIAISGPTDLSAFISSYAAPLAPCQGGGGLGVSSPIIVDGVTYSFTPVGVQLAITAAGTSGQVLIIPGHTITISSCTADASGTGKYGILLNALNKFQLIAYGTTFNVTANDVNCQAIEIRGSTGVSVLGATLTSANAGVGTGISFRRPSNADPGTVTVQNIFQFGSVSGFAVGAQVGLAADSGQVSENALDNNIFTDNTTDILQDGANSFTDHYIHNIAQAFTMNGTRLYDIECCSAVLTIPVTGGTATGTTHLYIGPNVSNIQVYSPHMEVAQDASAGDTGALAIDWHSLNTVGASMEVVGGDISDFRPSATSTLLNFGNGSTGGTTIFRNTNVYRAGGTATVTIGVPPFVFAEGGVWTNTSIKPNGPVVMGENGNPGSFTPAGGGFSGARNFIVPDISGTVCLSTAPCGAATAFQTNTTPLSSATTVNFQNAATFHSLTFGFSNPSVGNVLATLGGSYDLAGLTAPSANGDTVCALSLIWSECTPGVAPSTQTASTYTFLSSDRGKKIIFARTSAIAVTLPQAGSAGFGNNWYVTAANPYDGTQTGLVTITPTTSTVNGLSTLTLPIGCTAYITSDNTNYTAAVSCLPLSGATSTITPGALLAGACASGTVTLTGATTSMVATASPVTYPGDGNYWLAYVSAANTVTVKVCAAVADTPTASVFNVSVSQNHQ